MSLHIWSGKGNKQENEVILENNLSIIKNKISNWDGKYTLLYKSWSWEWHWSIDRGVPDNGNRKYKYPEVGQPWHVSAEHWTRNCTDL